MNDSIPLISVVMPVYNGEKYLSKAIESIITQTFTCFEFIIINDGSTDNSEKIILSFKDERIRYKKQENKGIGLSLHYGCSLVRGKYIARMDADDISNENRLQIQYDFLEKHSEVVLLSSAVRFIDEDGHTFGRSFPYTEDKLLKRLLKDRGSAIAHPSVMMRTDVYKKCGGYSDLQPMEDYYLWMKLSPYGKFVNLTTPYINYRILKMSISRSISLEQYAYLKNFLHQKIKDDVSEDDIIIEFRLLYQKFKKEGCGNKNNLTDLSANVEIKIYKLLKLFFVPDIFIEKVICSMKNQRMKYKYVFKDILNHSGYKLLLL